MFIPSRSIYILRQFDGFPSKIKCELRRDARLLENSGFHCQKTAYESDILNLYNNLYIQKYSHYNPKFTNEFVTLMSENELLSFHVLKTAQDKTIAVSGHFDRQGIMTTPIVGYDFSYDKSYGLYRQISIKLFLEAKKHNYILNHSSGVGRFKMNRGAERYWEYRVIFTKEINFYRRLIYKVLQFVINKIGVPMMDKMKL